MTGMRGLDGGGVAATAPVIPFVFHPPSVALVETGFGCNVAVLEPGLFAYVIIVEAASARTTAIVVSAIKGKTRVRLATGA